MDIGKIVLTMLMALALLSAPAGLRAEESLPVVNGVKVFRTVDNDIAVEISTDKKVAYTSYKMRDLFRVVVDIPESEPAKPETVLRYKSIIVSSIWLEKRNINGVPVSRVSINLSDDADYRVQADASDGTKLRLVLTRPAPGSFPGSTGALPEKDAKAASSAEPAAPGADPAKDVPGPAAAGTGSGNSVAKTGQPVTVTGVNCGADSIEIVSSSAIVEFRAFTLQQPGRLVIDIPGAQSTLRSLVLPANRFRVSRARIASSEGKLRIVFDAGKVPFPAHDVVKTASGLRIVSMTR